MKKNWEIKKLGEVLKLEYGKPLADDKRESNGTYPIYGANGIKGKTNEYLCNQKTIIVGRKGSAGEINLSDEKFWPLDVTYYVKFDKKKYDLIFLFYLMSLLELPKLAKGVKPGINRNEVYQMDAKFPPLNEQQCIAAILDETFAAISKAKANSEQNLKNAKELFESYLQNVFVNKGNSWEEGMIKGIGIPQTGTTPKTVDKENYGDFIPFIKPADVDFTGNGEIRYDNEGLSEQGLKNGRKILKGSVLMVCIGATIGKVGFAERDVSCNQQINSLTLKKDFYPKYFYYALRTTSFFEQVMQNAAQATLPIINKGKWEKLSVSYPKSLKEQQAIVQKLDALSSETKKLEVIYQKKLQDLEELKKSILQKAFNGELRTMDN